MEIRQAVTIITGASTGIGRATARALAAAGSRVVLAARSHELLEQLAGELHIQGAEAFVVPTDMCQHTQIQQLVSGVMERFGRVDILINNAGQGASGYVAEFDPEAYRRLWELNVLGPLLALQQVVPLMRSQGGGLIVNVSSTVTQAVYPGRGMYASTKHALTSLSDTARQELLADNIRVITVFPDRTTTDFARNAMRQGDVPLRAPAGGSLPPADSPEHVAARIVEAIRSEPARQYMR